MLSFTFREANIDSGEAHDCNFSKLGQAFSEKKLHTRTGHNCERVEDLHSLEAKKRTNLTRESHHPLRGENEVLGHILFLNG